MADEIQAFYERHPYPPPVDDLERYRRLWQDDRRRRADHHLVWPARPFQRAPRVLVAGCGTAQAAKHALRWPDACVTGIDVSSSSVRATLALKRKHDLRNLEVRELPLERAGELGATFDLIVCTGVLHHLADPDSGLAALRDVLAPDGAMQLMVYAPYGRTGVYMIQDLCRRIGLGPSARDIADLGTALEALPPGHPLDHLLRQAPDFQDDSALADALLNPRDRAYSVPQVFELVERAGLAFGRWARQAPYSPRCGVIARLPVGDRFARLSLGEQYASVELFRGTMVRHSFVVHRTPDAAATQRIAFAGDAWPGYVPLRMPDTLCIRERLPPGAAAVLINRAHSYNDLSLPIDARELAWFEAIDGARSIAELAGSREALGPARDFFERLYDHDQIVLDASRPAQAASRAR
jgi:SAM-dependent methyltransferase